ncbi:DNA ligase 1 [Auxenochlorella protothecoides]|uniref:DNA ligase 1 n=1 Tax=Auxenochlorella protothecoides TaxID=3075 RepID=A0A087SF17_AUXPR|nr:DNA ligase 1 [Auxenochlorella protothecoides]KFM24321.1 DNA ligase 1 [Auxenochlorella protothecoides]
MASSRQRDISSFFGGARVKPAAVSLAATSPVRQASSEPKPEPCAEADEGSPSPAAAAAKFAKVEGVGLGSIKAAAEHADFDLSKVITWTLGSPVPFGFLADTFEAIAEESKRLVITRILIGAFRAVIASTPADLLPMIYLCTNRVAPAHVGLELGIGDATLIKALAQVTGKKEAAVRAEYGQCGDLGAVAAAARGLQKTMFPPPRLTVPGVLRAFRDVAAAEGSGSQDRKKAMIVKLLVAARDNEAGYVMRALQGKLRIGLAEQTVLVALAHAAVLSSEAARAVKLAYSQCPSYDDLVPALLAHGPLRLPDHIYSRNSEDNTGKYPDIAALLPRMIKPGVKSAVLDAEAVAYDRVEKRVLPFQVLSTRARKDVSLASIKVAVCVFVFDCLYLDGRVLVQESLTTRREAMRAALSEAPGELQFATAKVSTDVEELSAFLDDAVDAGTEGLIVKTLGDTYEPSRRSSHWLKLKKDYLEGVGDTFDLVPIGAWHGRGKRTGMYGSYLLAVYDPENEEYQTISKIGTGFSEELLKQLAESQKELVIPGPRKYYNWGETLEPDVWFEPKAVWEIKAADLSISPVHKAATGLVDATKGISIRFPRLMRVRDDKGPEDSTSPAQVAEMYQAQAVVQQNSKASKPDVDDDY